MVTILIIQPKKDKESKESKYFLKDLSPFHFNQSLVTSQHCILMINHSDKNQAKISPDFSMKKSQGLIMGKEMLLLIAFIACFMNTYKTKIF